MIDTDKLRGRMVEKHVTFAQMANKMGISNRTFSRKMKIGVFGSDHIAVFIDVLDITNPGDYFYISKTT